MVVGPVTSDLLVLYKLQVTIDVNKRGPDKVDRGIIKN